MRRGIQLQAGHPERLQMELNHSKQKFHWDCGIACVLMVLPTPKRKNLQKNLSKILQEHDIYWSTWTIDLCYLLKYYQIPHIFCTTTLGIHSSYKTVNFYQKILSKDETRVLKHFENARQNGILIRRRTLHLVDILEHLLKGPIIVLVNANLLYCINCKFRKISWELSKCLTFLPVSYQGHYVVLCGYEVKTSRIYYRNPSLTDRVCVMSLEQLEKARKSFGTDEDIILIYV